MVERAPAELAAAPRTGVWPARRAVWRRAAEKRERSIWQTPLPGAGPSGRTLMPASTIRSARAAAAVSVRQESSGRHAKPVPGVGLGGAFPQARLLALAECGTRALTGAAIGSACRLKTEAPGTSYAIVEGAARAAEPGICSGSPACAPTRTCSRSTSHSGGERTPRQSPKAVRYCATCARQRQNSASTRRSTITERHAHQAFARERSMSFLQTPDLGQVFCLRCREAALPTAAGSPCPPV